MKSALNWFEIPVLDVDRAAACYDVLLGAKIKREVFGGMPYGIFPYEPPGVGGALFPAWTSRRGRNARCDWIGSTPRRSCGRPPERGSAVG